VPSELSRDQVSHLTKLGAKIRLAEIKRERAALIAMIDGRATAATPTGTPSQERVTRRRRREKWTAAQRRAVSERMKKYWAKRRASARRA
jgi:hypothetical protein